MITAILAAALAWGDLANPYTLLAMLVLAAMAALGALDDLAKIFTSSGGLPVWVKLAGQVVVALVVAMSFARNGRLAWERLEMIKGIRGMAYPERHEVPLLDNTPRESQLEDTVKAALADLPAHAHGIFVRDHGAYIWGRDVWEAKRHAEVYDWLCQYSNAQRATGGASGAHLS